MTTRTLLIIASLALLAGLHGCSSDDTPTSPGGEPPRVVLAPDPDGMLLPGDPDDDAREATVTLAPSPVDAADIDGSLLTTRLAAVMTPGATVAQVNAALTAQGAAIVSMAEGDPYLVLVIDAVADRAEAEGKAAALVAGGAFLYARPGLMAPRAEDVAPAGQKDYPANGALANVAHLLPGRLPAAWNLRRGATSRAALVVPDWYVEAGTVPELPLLRFASYGGRALTPDDDIVYGAGNQGYHHFSVAAGTWAYDGSRPHTGADPLGAELLDTIGVHTYGLDQAETILATALAISRSTPTVVLSTDTFADPDAEVFRFLDRAYLGLRWRHLTHSVLFGPNFLHVVPAGNTGESAAAFNDAALNSAAGIATITDLGAPTVLDGTEDEQAAFAQAMDAIVTLFPAVAEPLDNVLIVGSSDASGTKSGFSTPGSHVRTAGENVSGTCLVIQCQDGASSSSSSVAAAAQVAGLAAYMWHLDASRSVSDMLLRLQHAYSASGRPGILDATIAVLSLDGANIGRMRRTLVDVSGPNARPDGVFTEHDIEAFLDAFDSFSGSLEPDWSVYDLNGDGWTNGENGARMDLDANDLPGFTSVHQSIEGNSVDFAEGDVTDQEVLCYYAYSDLYTGSTTVRAELLGGHCGASQATLPGSSAFSDYDLTADDDSVSLTESANGSDDTVIDDFGDYATSVSNQVQSGPVTATGLATTTASLHREAGGTVTLDVDGAADADVTWTQDYHWAEAATHSQIHVGLELVGEHIVTVSGRLNFSGPGTAADARTYVHVGPDSTVAGWTFPNGSWDFGGWTEDGGVQDIEPVSVTVPDGVHRIWVNVQLDAIAEDDTGDFSSGSRSASSDVDLLVVIAPADAKKSDVRVISGR